MTRLSAAKYSLLPLLGLLIGGCGFEQRDVMSWEELGETQLTMGGLVVLASIFVVLFRPLRDKAIALMVITGFVAGFFALWMFRVTDLQAIGIVVATIITMFAAGLLLPTWAVVILFGAFGGALGFVAPVLWEDLIGWHYYLGCAIGIVLYAGSFYAFKRAGAIIDPRSR